MNRKNLLTFVTRQRTKASSVHEDFNAVIDEILAEFKKKSDGVLSRPICILEQIDESVPCHIPHIVTAKEMTGKDQVGTRKILEAVKRAKGLHSQKSALVLGMSYPYLLKEKLVTVAMPPIKDAVGDRFFFSFLQLNPYCIMIYANLANPDRLWNGEELFLFSSLRGTTYQSA